VKPKEVEMMVRRVIVGLAGSLLLVTLLGACGSREEEIAFIERSPYVYVIPVARDDGWTTGHVEETPLSLEVLETGVEQILAGDYPEIHSILIAHDSRIVFEDYFPGHTQDGSYVDFDFSRPHDMASVTKSITSLIVGIAIDRGYIDSIDESVLRWFPEYSADDKEEKAAITIGDILTMRAGLKWNELERSYFDRQNDVNRLWRSRDPVDFILSRPVVAPAGSSFYYNGGGIDLLAEVILRATDQSLDEFADDYLFGPLGITSPEWAHFRSGLPVAAGGLKLTPRDLLKVGELILQRGTWFGDQIVSTSWIERSTSAEFPIESDLDFGLMWWLPRATGGGTPIDVIMAAGFGGQYLLVFPKQGICAVLTGGNYREDDQSIRWIEDVLIPSFNG
jgi:CubicO group peptidase (beta-lactamase class C family)